MDACQSLIKGEERIRLSWVRHMLYDGSGVENSNMGLRSIVLLKVRSLLESPASRS